MLRIDWNTKIKGSLGSRIVYMLHNCYTLITLLIVIPGMIEASHTEGLIPMWAKHTVGMILFTDELSW